MAVRFTAATTSTATSTTTATTTSTTTTTHLHHPFHRHHLQALDDVEGQFVGGMQQVAAPLLGGVPASDVATLCAAAVRAHRRKLDLEYDIPHHAT